MRFKSALCAAGAIFFAFAAAEAQDMKPYTGPYLGAHVGVNFQSNGDENEVGFNYGLLGGWRTHVSDRIVLGGYVRFSESRTTEPDFDVDLILRDAERWSFGGTAGYTIFKDYLISAEVGYAETSIDAAEAILVNPLPEGDVDFNVGREVDVLDGQDGLRLAISFEKPIEDYVNIRSTVSRTKLSNDLDSWTIDVGFAFHF